MRGRGREGREGSGGVESRLDGLAPARRPHASRWPRGTRGRPEAGLPARHPEHRPASPVAGAAGAAAMLVEAALAEAAVGDAEAGHAEDRGAAIGPEAAEAAVEAAQRHAAAVAVVDR